MRRIRRWASGGRHSDQPRTRRCCSSSAASAPATPAPSSRSRPGWPAGTGRAPPTTVSTCTTASSPSVVAGMKQTKEHGPAGVVFRRFGRPRPRPPGGDRQSPPRSGRRPPAGRVRSPRARVQGAAAPRGRTAVGRAGGPSPRVRGLRHPVHRRTAEGHTAVGAARGPRAGRSPHEPLRISTRRMRARVPEAAHFGFGPAHLDHLVAGYVREPSAARYGPARG